MTVDGQAVKEYNIAMELISGNEQVERMRDLAFLRPGETAFAPLPRQWIGLEANRIRARVHRLFGKGNYMTRTVLEDGRFGVRVWRTG